MNSHSDRSDIVMRSFQTNVRFQFRFHVQPQGGLRVPRSELEGPRDRLKKAGATVEIISLGSGEIRGWDKKDWGRPVKVDKTLDQVTAAEYDAVVLPGGHQS
jgi:hypothetical protein